MSEEQQGQGASRGRTIIAWVVAPLVCIAFFPTFLLMVIGMAPSIVAYIVDVRAGKVTARAIGYLNFAGCLPYAFKLWTGQNTISGVIELVFDPSALMIMYSSAAVGWMLVFIMSPIMSAYLVVLHEAKLRSIASRQEALVKEWGKEVRGRHLQASPAKQREEVSNIEGDNSEANAESKDSKDP